MFEAILTKTEYVTSFEHDFFQTDQDFRAQFAKDITSGEHLMDEYEALREFKGKKAVLHGEHDPSASLEYLTLIKEALQFDLTIIPDCGHFPTIEQPTFFNDYLGNFANECFSRP